MKAEGISGTWRGRVLLAAMMVGWCACASLSLAQSRQSTLVGKPAPGFKLQGVYGESYSLAQFKGHLLVMQFGSSW
jgi:cytochrome oxidase Cu insertion factor (SCO1/SenC/PrrC family)